MKIRFWGTRGSIAVPGKDTTGFGGNTTCVELLLESGRRVIIDAGTGIRALGEELSQRDRDLEIHILITHIHWDHVLGFPFFEPIYWKGCRILIDGAPTCMKGLRYPFDNMMGDGFFPVKFHELSARITYLDRLRHGPLVLDDTVIEKVELHHPQGGYGFKFSWGKKSMVFITDNELRHDGWKGRKIKDYVRFFEGADLLIHDSQYLPEEMETKKGWGHSDCLTVVDAALSGGVRHLILFHHDPSRKDHQVEEMVALARAMVSDKGASLAVDAAREGDVIQL